MAPAPPATRERVEDPGTAQTPPPQVSWDPRSSRSEHSGESPGDTNVLLFAHLLERQSGAEGAAAPGLRPTHPTRAGPQWRLRTWGSLGFCERKPGRWRSGTKDTLAPTPLCWHRQGWTQLTSARGSAVLPGPQTPDRGEWSTRCPSAVGLGVVSHIVVLGSSPGSASCWCMPGARDPDGAPGPRLQPGPAPAVAHIWAVRQQMGELCLSVWVPRLLVFQVGTDWS